MDREYTSKVDELVKDKLKAKEEVKSEEREENSFLTGYLGSQVLYGCHFLIGDHICF